MATRRLVLLGLAVAATSFSPIVFRITANFMDLTVFLPPCRFME